MAILAIAADGVTKPGVFHFCSSGTTTWHGFAHPIFDLAGERSVPRVGELSPIPSREYPTPAPRPANSALDCSRIAKAYGITAPPWRKSPTRCLDELR